MQDHTHGPFEPTWESLKDYQVAQWYLNGKFGIFIHWGLYSVPAFGNEWYARTAYLEGSPEFEHHVKTYGPHAKFGYKDFIPLLTGEKFDPVAWIDLFKEAGARFVVPVAEHHDGFAMYDSSHSEWTAAKMGPKRDIVGELAAAARERGLIFGASSHRAEHWWFFEGGRMFDSDVQDPAYDAFYGPAAPSAPPDPRDPAWRDRDWQPRPHAKFLEDWLARTCEIIDKYQPQLLWFDWWIEQVVFEPYLQRLAAYYYNRAAEWGKEVAINYKNKSFAEGSAVLDVERGQLKGLSPVFWQNDTAVSKNSWGYISNQDYKDPGDIVCDLVDVVSKNGALLLNVGPRPDGTIPDKDANILRAIGRWLSINGEAIYDTRPWQRYGEGPTEINEGPFTDMDRDPFTGQDFRFTKKGSVLYAVALAWPGKEALIRSLSLGTPTSPITSVSLLGAGPVEWLQGAEGLRIKMPAEKPCEYAFTFKIQCEAPI
jgi:alpha-L-fucosidase